MSEWPAMGPDAFGPVTAVQQALPLPLPDSCGTPDLFSEDERED